MMGVREEGRSDGRRHLPTAAMVRAVVVMSLLCGTVRGVPVTYIGTDAGAGPDDPRPNSDGAAASFDAAAESLGPISIIGFEDLPMGNFTSLTVAPGVTATQTDNDPALGGIVTVGYATPLGAPTGYNLTPGGSKFLGFVPKSRIGTATLAFAFETPIQAWGAYVVGLDEDVNGDLFVEFNDGQVRSFEIPQPSVAGAQFFGVTDPGASITEVGLVLRNVITGSRDIYGIDEVRYVPIPEPATILLIVAGVLGLRRKRTRRGPPA